MTRREYHVQNIQADGQPSGPVLIYPITSPPSGITVGRRSFLQAGAAAASLIASQQSAQAAKPDTVGPTVAKVVFAHTGPIHSLKFSENGLRLASGSSDKMAKVWDLDGGEPLFVANHADAVKDVAFVGPNSLATACNDHEIRVWSLAGDASVRRFSGHRRAVTALALPNPSKLVSADQGGEIRVWDVDTATTISTSALPAPPTDACLSADGQSTFWAVRTQKIIRHAIDDGALADELAGPAPWATAIACGAHSKPRPGGLGGGGLVIGGVHGKVSYRRLGDPESQILVDHHERILDIAIAADESMVVSSSRRKLIFSDVRKALSGDPEAHHTIELPFAVTALAISPDGTLLASGDVKGVIKLWSLRRRELIGFIHDPRVSVVDAHLYRTKKVGVDRTLVFALPIGFPAPRGAVRVADLLHKPEPELEPKPKSKFPPRRGPSAKERLDAIIQARQFYHQRKIAKKQKKIEEMQRRALLAYQWRLEQFYRYHYQSSGSSSSRTVCTCNTISY